MILFNSPINYNNNKRMTNWSRRTVIVIMVLVLFTTINRTTAKNYGCQADTPNCDPEEILKRTPNYILFQHVRDRRNRAYQREQRKRQSAIPVNGFLAAPATTLLPLAFAVGIFVGLVGSRHTYDCGDRIHTMVISVLLFLYLIFIITGPGGLAVALSQAYACACTAIIYMGATFVGDILAYEFTH